MKAALVAGLLVTGVGSASERIGERAFGDAELATLRSLSIDALPPLPASPGNPVADAPDAIALGHRLFFEPALSVNGEVACSTCHRPDMNFRDPFARGRAIGETARRTMTVVGSAWSPWLFWDGRRDSLWAQALEPLEDLAEHGGTRVAYARTLADDERLKQLYETVFGALPELHDERRFPRHAGPGGDEAAQTAWRGMSETDRRLIDAVFANLGRALEAYQRRLRPGAAPFDRYVRRLSDTSASSRPEATDLTPQQEHGLALFIGKAQCTHCHNGPLFTNNEFHNTGLFGSEALPTDRGRIEGVKQLLADPFNCLNTLGDEHGGACDELDFVKTSGVELVAAFRTPTLRNIAPYGPFMHTGQFATLAEVIDHYDRAPPTLISDELEPLHLDETERAALEAFLWALVGPLDTDPALLAPPAEP